MPQPFRLKDQPIIAFVAISDAARAKDFYGGTLGLQLRAEELQFALVFDAHGIMLRLTLGRKSSPATYTVLGWEVEDITAAAQAMAESGVQFERFEGLGQDGLGIWTSPTGSKVAWFKDPDGNTLSISQHS